MELICLRGEQWIPLVDASMTEVPRLGESCFRLSVMIKAGPHESHRVARILTITHEDWLGGKVEIAERSGGWCRLSIDALFRKPVSGSALASVGPDHWTRTIRSECFPCALVITDSGVKEEPGVPPPEAIVQTIAVDTVPNAGLAGWCRSDFPTGHAKALEDSLVLVGSVEFDVSGHALADSFEVSLEFSCGDIVASVSFDNRDLILGQLSCEAGDEGQRIKFDGIAAIPLRETLLASLAASGVAGNGRQVAMHGIVSHSENRRLCRSLVIDGKPLHFLDKIAWPGDWAIGLQRANVGLVRSDHRG
jgi:hypothetical protein